MTRAISRSSKLQKRLESSKAMYFREALRYSIKTRKFLISHKIYDISDEDATDDDADYLDTSNHSKTDSDSNINPDGWDIPLDVWGELNDNMESRGLTLKEKEKEILKLFFNAV